MGFNISKSVLNALKNVDPAEIKQATSAPTSSGGATITRTPGRGLFGGRLAGLLRGGRMGFKEGGQVKGKSASARADGCAQRGKTKGKIV